MKKILTLMMVVLLVALSVMPVMADNYTDSDWTDDDSSAGTVDGKVVEIIKYFTTSKSSEILDVNFTYEVSVPTVADDGVDEDTNVYIPAMEPTYYTATDTLPEGKNVGDLKTPGYATVYAGIGLEDPNNPKVKVYWKNDTADPKADKIHFSETDQGETVKDGDFKGDDKDTKKTSIKTLAVDFSGIKFTEPGIYRYWIQESSSSALTLNDTQVKGANNTWRTIDVYVIDPETGDHNILVTGDNKSATYPSYSVVYEGKLTNAPRIDIDFTPKPFDGTQSEVITGTKWTYENTDDSDDIPNGTYVYEYVGGSVLAPPTNAGDAWEETFTPAGGTTETKRNRDTHLDKATGQPQDKTKDPAEDIVYTPGTYQEAVDMGATEAQIKGTGWTYSTTDPVATYTYQWDTTESKWKKSGVSNGVVDEPRKEAKANVPTTSAEGGPTQEMTYEAAKQTQAYIDGVLTTLTWVYEDTAAGTTYTYTWDGSNKRWNENKVVETEKAPEDEAEGRSSAPATPFNVSPVKYEYVLETQRAGFVGGSEGYNAALRENPNGTEAGEKTDNYVNEYFTQKLEVSKTVTGNQGSRDKYFKYTITIEDVPEGSVIKYDDTSVLSFDKAKADPAETYPETVPNAATTYKESEMAIVKAGDKEVSGNSINTYTVVKPASYTETDPYKEDVVITVFLQHGQKLVLEGIPKGCQYTVVEDNYSAEGYKASVEVKAEKAGATATDPATPLDNMTNDGDNDASNDAEITSADGRTVTDSAIMKDAAIAYTNTKSGVIPTGVFMSITGGVALIAIAIGAIAVLNRRRAEEEE